MKSKVFLICTGLGHINRGYESFTRECFDALKNNEYFDLYLFKGGGKSSKFEKKLINLPRRKRLTKKIAGFLKFDSYTIEQITFCISLLPHLISKKPAVIYYSDFELGTYLWHLRKYFKFKYKLLFSNGAPNGPPFKTEDHVQQLLPVYLKQAIGEGAPAAMQTLLPYGFDIDLKQRVDSLGQRNLMRKELGLPESKKIILSVGAINKHHKRMDYLINEIAAMSNDYFVVILGQFEAETEEIIKLAQQKLPGRFIIDNVPYTEVTKYYIAADVFALCSLNEGFGRVLIEAASYGLPCMVHDYINAREVLADIGIYVNMKTEGQLKQILSSGDVKSNKKRLINSAYQNYSWIILKNQYLEMIMKLFPS